MRKRQHNHPDQVDRSAAEIILADPAKHGARAQMWAELWQTRHPAQAKLQAKRAMGIRRLTTAVKGSFSRRTKKGENHERKSP